MAIVALLRIKCKFGIMQNHSWLGLYRAHSRSDAVLYTFSFPVSIMYPNISS